MRSNQLRPHPTRETGSNRSNTALECPCGDPFNHDPMFPQSITSKKRAATYNLGVAEEGRQVQRGAAVLVGVVNGGGPLQQGPDDVEVTLEAGPAKGGQPFLVTLVD